MNMGPLLLVLLVLNILFPVLLLLGNRGLLPKVGALFPALFPNMGALFCWLVLNGLLLPVVGFLNALFCVLLLRLLLNMLSSIFEYVTWRIVGHRVVGLCVLVIEHIVGLVAAEWVRIGVVV